MMLTRRLQNFLEGVFHLPQLGSVEWKEMEIKYDQHQQDLKQRFPVRYFLTFTVIDNYLYPIEKTIDDAYWWVRYHTTDRYHYLDLRQPKRLNHFSNPDGYSYGYQDIDRRMLYAMFNLLCQFVEHELSTVYISPEALQRDASLQFQYDRCVEIKALYRYWKVERQELHRQIDMAQEERMELQNQFDAKEDEMLMRLLKVRRFLWS